MHYIYADSNEYHRFINPKKSLIPLSVAGIFAIRFLRLSDAIKYKQDNEANFTFIDDDDDRVSSYWDFNGRMQQS